MTGSWARGPRALVVAIVIGVAAAAVIVTALLALIAVPFLLTGCIGLPDSFEAGAWRAADPTSSCSARTRMVDELLVDGLPPGRDRAEIERLLGPTEDVDYWLSEADGLVYVINCWIDCNWLVIEFDGDDHLTRAYRAQD